MWVESGTDRFRNYEYRKGGFAYQVYGTVDAECQLIWELGIFRIEDGKAGDPYMRWRAATKEKAFELMEEFLLINSSYLPKVEKGELSLAKV